MASTYPAQVIIVVPKRLFKKAVHRNRIKRQIRECYRLQKDSFYEHLLKEGIGVNLALIYFAPEFYKTHEIMHSLQTLLQKVK